MKAAALKLLSRNGVTLPEDATDEQISAAIDALPAEDKKPEGFSAEPPPWAVALQKQVSDLSATVVQQKATTEQQQKDALVDGAKRAGKVIPFSADVIGLLTPDQLKKELDAVKPTLPMQRETPGADAFGSANPGASDELTPEEKRMAEAMGTDLDALKKTPRV